MLGTFLLGGAGVLVVAVLRKTSTMPASRRCRLRSHRGMGFVTLVWFYSWRGGAAGPVPLLPAALVTLWGVRPSGHVSGRQEAA